jgi:hypothetical protein
MIAATLMNWLIVVSITIDLIATIWIAVRARARERETARSIEARFDRLERSIMRRLDEISLDRSASSTSLGSGSRAASVRADAIDSCDDARDTDKGNAPARDSGGSTGSIGGTARFGFRSKSSGRDVRIRVDERRSTRGDFSHASEISTLIEIPDVNTKGDVSAPSDALIEFENRFGLIWEMADEGRGDDEIARATGYPIGQIELILGLRRRSAAASRSDL